MAPRNVRVTIPAKFQRSALGAAVNSSTNGTIPIPSSTANTTSSTTADVSANATVSFNTTFPTNTSTPVITTTITPSNTSTESYNSTSTAAAVTTTTPDPGSGDDYDMENNVSFNIFSQKYNCLYRSDNCSIIANPRCPGTGKFNTF